MLGVILTHHKVQKFNWLINEPRFVKCGPTVQPYHFSYIYIELVCILRYDMVFKEKPDPSWPVGILTCPLSRTSRKVFSRTIYAAILSFILNYYMKVLRNWPHSCSKGPSVGQRHKVHVTNWWLPSFLVAYWEHFDGSLEIVWNLAHNGQFTRPMSHTVKRFAIFM